ncbi:MBL fold metallo-hydrolase [Ruminococcus sp.]|uniref:MBL fold metallo-hydrolase n=1 Tax=Ruminococcus sp. TaxID=41978 RepID=UPI0025FAB254|nr:MBL fold metallo-hydrolase [Ruminococcus sp.]MBQ8966366.1 MBL fold metallo-hydrolase [Ruminococcus sp.]
MITDNIKVIKHSCVRIECGIVIYIDPFMVEGAPHDADLVLVTHPHFDHFSPPNIRKVAKQGTVVAGPYMLKRAKAVIGGCSLVPLSAGQKTNLCGINIEAVPAYNLKPARPHKRFLGWLGYVLDIGGEKVYITGDTDATPESKAVKCDVLMLPVGGSNYTMNAAEAADLANTIRPKTVIPIHYGALLGGRQAAQKFKDLVSPDIHTDIRPTVYSNAMVYAYSIAAAAIALLLVVYFALL